MTDICMTTFIEDMKRKLVSTGLGDAQEIVMVPVLPSFGDATAIFSIGPSLLRFVRERKAFGAGIKLRHGNVARSSG
jgi:hypothetical protein